MADWYHTHSGSPGCYPESEYIEWALEAGARVDDVGNVIWSDQEPRTDPNWDL